MKKLKGEMTIEMTDVNTGITEIVAEENMLTNAVNDILGSNPMGIFYDAENTYYSEEIQWQGTLLPLCPNMIGGILLFATALTENADNVYTSSDNLPGAYASNDVNATVDTNRGSMNLVESKEIPGGYRFVWEFTPAQGNGPIAAVALTSKQGGVGGFGSLQDAVSAFLKLKFCRLNAVDTEKLRYVVRAVELDFETGSMYSLLYATGTITISKIHTPVFDVGLTENLNGMTYTIESAEVITPAVFSPLYQSWNSRYQAIFLDGKDGYWYGFANGSSGNSSGDASVQWIKIKKEDNTFTEGTWTLSNTQLTCLGYYQNNNDFTYYRKACLIRNGYLYALSYDCTSVYKINLSNSTDITLISLGITVSNGIGASQLNTRTFMCVIGDLIVGRGWQIDIDDNVILVKDEALFEYSPVTDVFQYKEFLISIGADSSNMNLQAYLFTPFNVTINNLSSSVAKTADKSMKITYELTEQSS